MNIDLPQHNIASHEDILLKDAYMFWLLTFKKPTITGRTLEGHLFRSKKHIMKLGDFHIGQIETMDIQQLLNNMLEDKYSLDLVRKVKNDFNQFYTYAVETDIVKQNPVLQIKLKGTQLKQHNKYLAIPEESRQSILDALENESILKPMVLTMMYAGLRCSEMLALKWHHIDFKQCTITVAGAVSKNAVVDDNGNILCRENSISHTKTSCGLRKIKVGPFLLHVLEEWYGYQRVIEKNGNCFTGFEDLVFPTRSGQLRTYAGLRSSLNRFYEKYALQKFSAHAYRHTFATMLFENDVNPRIVQLLMGHQRVTTTLEIYNSVSLRQINQALDIIEPRDSPSKLSIRKRCQIWLVKTLSKNI